LDLFCAVSQCSFNNNTARAQAAARGVPEPLPPLLLLLLLLHCRLLVVMWLFWEAYFATVGSVVKVSNWTSAVLAKWQYTHKWGAKAKQGKQ
jgi:hypothetical protein